MKKVLLSGLLLTAILLGVGIYFYTLKPADTRKETSDYRLSANDLMAAFASDEQAAGERYVDKVLSVTGVVADVKFEESESTVFLATSDPLSQITCSFYADEAASTTPLRKGDKVTIKGLCTGKLIDVVLNHCSLEPTAP